MKGLTIGKLAATAGVGVDTVRFYERAGLLPPAARAASGYRVYRTADADRLRFIRRAKTLGFSLDEVRNLLALNDGGGRRDRVRVLAGRRLAEVERKLGELTGMRDVLADLIASCHGDGPLAGCPIIEKVAAADGAAPDVEKVTAADGAAPGIERIAAADGAALAGHLENHSRRRTARGKRHEKR